MSDLYRDQSRVSGHAPAHEVQQNRQGGQPRGGPTVTALAPGVSDGDSEDEGLMLSAGTHSVRARVWVGGSVENTRLGTGTGKMTGLSASPGFVAETETEDEPMKSLPTARHPAPPSPSTFSFSFPFSYKGAPSGQGRLRQRHPVLASLIGPILLVFRLLAIVPASAGTLHHIYHLFHPPPDGPSSRVDHGIAILWCILTAHQCFMLATGLLHRWKVYYSLLPTLIRLLALQAICWPATHFTLSLFDHSRRPLVCWTVVGCTTSVSRAIQIWVTSNLARDRERKWDWVEIGRKCIAPAMVVHIIMAWALVIGKEFAGCCGA